MRNVTYDQAAPKKPADDLSQTLDQHLVAIIGQAQRSQWLVENKPALDEHSRCIEARGTFSGGLRRL